VTPRRGPFGSAHGAALRRCVRARLITHLATATEDRSLSPAAAADLSGTLVELGKRLGALKSGDSEDPAAAHYYADIITHDKLKDCAEKLNAGHAVAPPGPPIGAEREDGWFSEAAW
jgi:hypothetical protein